MATLTTHAYLDSYQEDSFRLKQHLQDFLAIDAATLEQKLQLAQEDMKELGHRDFDWEKATDFYRDRVGEMYLFELGAWHLTSKDYIGDLLRLIADRACGKVLDFGGGIGTHAIGAALCPQVERVIYCDLNPISIDFVRYRAQELGLEDKIICCQELSPTETFDTILCFDVLEHLPDPSERLLKFYDALTVDGRLITNWYFSKGANGEYPFHLDDPHTIDRFFQTLQTHFLEVFHPYFITTRCYRKWLKD
jgi:2-polyprenyl-3-methyl-5-hydroxy-6-metoxy-1,4-benzoquinol methylase